MSPSFPSTSDLVQTGIGRAPAVPSRAYFDKYYRSRDWRVYRSILAAAVSHSEPGPVLDVGAGVGFLVEAASQWGLFCVGLEGSIGAIEIARERRSDINLAQHILGDPFPFSDATFQTVFLNQVIEHLSEEVAVCCLHEIWRVLRDNGMVFVASPSKFNSQEASRDPTHIKLYAPEELSRLLHSVGFRTIIARNQPRPLLGHNRYGCALMEMCFRVLPWDRLSNSADCIAFKRR